MIVVPTYDEAGNVEELLRRLRAAMPAAEVLVVDDASPDGTAGRVEQVGAELGGVEVLRRARKEGLGSAYRAGLARALRSGADVVVQMDADLSHAPEAVPSLVAAVHGGADLAIGSRYVPGGSILDWSWRRRWLSRWGNRYVAALLRLHLADATSGFRAWSAPSLAGLDLGTVTASGYSFQVELARRLVRAGGRVVELPITFADRTRGTSKLSWRIIGEEWWLVTRWAARDLVVRRWERRPRRRAPVAE